MNTNEPPDPPSRLSEPHRATAGIDGDHDGQASILDPADAIYSAARLDCDNLAAIQAAGISGDPTGPMLAAYNAGLGTVLGCRCLPAIPQTQNYVASIEALAPELAAVASSTPAATGGELSYPLAVRAIVSQTYGPHTGGTFHPGIDLAAPAGTPILAATGGTVHLRRLGNRTATTFAWPPLPPSPPATPTSQPSPSPSDRRC